MTVNQEIIIAIRGQGYYPADTYAGCWKAGMFHGFLPMTLK